MGAALAVAVAMTATTLVAGGTSASAAGCRVEVAANTPTKSGTRMVYTGSYRVSSCDATFTVELRLHRGPSQVATYRFNSSAPMAGTSSLRSSAACSGTARYHTELVVVGSGFSGHAASRETGSISC